YRIELYLFFFCSCGDLRHLHSFPTRRSSDLSRGGALSIEPARRSEPGGAAAMTWKRTAAGKRQGANEHRAAAAVDYRGGVRPARSEEHTSELQSRGHLVCRLLLEKKK